MTTQVHEETFNELRECPICQESFKEAVALPCLHVFCNELCLQNWIRTSERPTCPTCRVEFDPHSVKPFHFIKNFVDDVCLATGLRCNDCKTATTSSDLQDCDHCRKKICGACRPKHLEKLKQQIAMLCDVFNTELGQNIESVEDRINKALSKMFDFKQEIVKQLEDLHEVLVSQIHDVQQRSLQVLEKVEQHSLSDIDAQIKEIDKLRARVSAILANSADLEKEGDIGNLVKIDTEITHLQKDIESAEAKVAALKSNNVTKDRLTLESLKINLAYKNILDLIKQTEKLRKLEPSSCRDPRKCNRS